MASKRTVRISDEVLVIVHAFSDPDRKNGIRDLAGRVRALEDALGEIAACAAWCEDCEPTERKLATHTTHHCGVPMFLCDEHAEETRAAYRKAESKGCGKQPDVEPHEQEVEHEIALRSLGYLPSNGTASERKDER